MEPARNSGSNIHTMDEILNENERLKRENERLEKDNREKEIFNRAQVDLNADKDKIIIVFKEKLKKSDDLLAVQNHQNRLGNQPVFQQIQEKQKNNRGMGICTIITSACAFIMSISAIVFNILAALR